MAQIPGMPFLGTAFVAMLAELANRYAKSVLDKCK